MCFFCDLKDSTKNFKKKIFFVWDLEDFLLFCMEFHAKPLENNKKSQKSQTKNIFFLITFDKSNQEKNQVPLQNQVSLRRLRDFGVSEIKYMFY